MKTLNWNYIQPHRKNGECGMRLPISYYLLFIVCSFILAGGFMYALDKYTDRQQEMLCTAAKISGNEYQEKCKCFYDGGEIGCIGRKQ